jgi:hypothetical protein
MISSVNNNLKTIKMKTPILDEFIEELQEFKDDNLLLTKDLEERLIEFKNIKAAINYTHSCKSDSEQLVCNYCLEQVSTLPDNFGCQSCIDNYK